jgi:hypothetical protein
VWIEIRTPLFSQVLLSPLFRIEKKPMSTPPTDSFPKKPQKNPSSILWRELRFSEDQEYAFHLLELIIDKPLSRWGAGVMILLSAAIVGGLNCLLFLLLQQTFLRPFFEQWPDGSWFYLIGLVVGGLIGTGLILDLRQQQKLSWSRTLPLLVPTSPIQIRHPLDWEAFYFKLIIATGGGLGIATIEMIFGNFNNEWITFYAGLISIYLVVAIIFGPFFQEVGRSSMALGMMSLFIVAIISCCFTSNLFYRDEIHVVFWTGAIIEGSISLFLSARAGKGLALRLGLPNSLILGILLGSVMAVFFGEERRGTGVETINLWFPEILLGIVGTGVGIYVGRGTGLDRLLKGQLILIIIGVITTSISWTPGWFADLFIGSIIGWFSQLFWPTRPLTLAEIYLHRHYYLWGFDSPSTSEVKAALQQSTQSEMWLDLFQQAEVPLNQAETVETLITIALGAEDWQKRFIARRKLVVLGGEAAPHLAKSLEEDSPSEANKLARWLLQSIVDDTRRRLARRASHLFCAQCFTRCGSHFLFLNPEMVRYYGCRTCGQSRHFFNCSEGRHLVAVLGGTAKLTSIDPEGNVRVNWLSRQALFDFDGVEIIKATDEQVERFAIQVGNDTDPVRRGRYKQISCLIRQPDLSDNSLRILRRLFGRVEILSFVPSSATLS